MKLGQDQCLVQEVQARLREESSEKQACLMDYAALKRAIRERSGLQRTMLFARYRQHETMQRNNVDSTEDLSKVC